MTEAEQKLKEIIQEATLLILSSLTVMAGSTISPAIKSMAEFFSSTPNAAFLSKLSLTIPAVAFVFVAPITGIIIDKLGRKPLLLTSLILYIIAGSSGFYLKSLYLIIAGRVILGIAVAGIMNVTLTLIADYYSGEKRNRVLGFQVAVNAFGGVIYLIVGGALADISWNCPFLVYLFPVVLIPTTIISLPEPERKGKEQNDGKQQSKDQSVTHPEKAENKGETKKGIIILSYILIFFIMLVFYTGPTQLSFYIPTVDPSVNNLLIGLAMALVNLMAGLIGLFFKPVRRILSTQLIFIIGFSVFGTGFLILYFAKNYAIILLSAVVGGLGFGLVMPNLSLFLVSNTLEDRRGIIFSGYNAMLYLGQFLSPIVFEPIINATSLGTIFLVGSLVLFGLVMIPTSIVLGNTFAQKNNKS
jgi:MFS family permease